MEPEASDNNTIEDVRVGQRMIVLAIFINFLAFISTFGLPNIGGLMVIVILIKLCIWLVSIVVSLLGVVRLSTGLGYGLGAQILIFISMFIPCVNLIVLLIISSKATTLLRAAGYKVGLLGALPKNK